MHFEYTKKAAELGLREAQHNLADLYIQKEEIKAGFAWLLHVAKQDFLPSMVNVGTLFLYGRGEIAINPLAAYI